VGKFLVIDFGSGHQNQIKMVFFALEKSSFQAMIAPPCANPAPLGAGA
jgi:hypothetical protein